MILIRRLLGDVLRRKRQNEGRTLRQLAAEARISPGYLSEIERGQKEPSSELLAAICDALHINLSDLLREVSVDLAAAELAARIEAERMGVPVPVGAGAVPGARVGSVSGSNIGAVPVGKAAVLAKPVARAAAHPTGRPGSRPAVVRTPPTRRAAQQVATAPSTAQVAVPVSQAGTYAGVGVFADADRVMTFPLITMGDLALR